MMRNVCTLAIVVPLLLFQAPSLGAVLPAPQTPTLDAVLVRAGEYVTAFHESFRLIVADESYVQIQRGYGVASGDLAALGATAGESTGHKVRKIKSEFALIANPGSSTWHGFRDVLEVDGKPVQDQKDRLRHLFVEAPATAYAEARRIDDEGSRYNLGGIKRTINIPTFTLMCLLPKNQAGFEFKKKAEKKVGGVTAWVISFVEKQRPTFIMSPAGAPMPTRGEVWIDPATGRVLRTQVVVDSLDAFEELRRRPERYNSFPRIQIDVTFGQDARLNLWVPLEMQEVYDRQAEVVTCTATYSNFRRFETDAKLIVK